MTNRPYGRAAAWLMSLLSCAAPAVADDYRDLGFSVGYAQSSIDAEALDDLDSQSGLRFELRGTWSPGDEPSGLRFGIALGLSSYYDEEDSGQTVGGFADVEDFEQLFLAVPEFQVTWRQPISEHWLIEGGAGVGPVIANFRAGQVIFDDLFDEDVSEWDVGLGVRPLVRAAYRRNRWMAGLEGSYLFTDLDFGNGLSGNVEELYIGFFYSHMF